MKIFNIYLTILLLTFSVISCNFGGGGDSQKHVIAHFDFAEPDLSLSEFSPQEPKYLFIHSIDSDPSKYRWTVDKLINLFLIEFKWSKVGYHEYIDYDSQHYELVTIDCDNVLSFNELAWGVKGKNYNSIHIALEGGHTYFGGRKIYIDNFSTSQKQKLKQRIEYYKYRFPNIEVLPHNAVSNKACPVLNIHDL